MTILVRGLAHEIVSYLCKGLGLILLLEHVYFAYVYWNFHKTKLAVAEFGIDDTDRRYVVL